MCNMKNMRSNKGITLLSVIIYMIAAILVIGILAAIRNFFFDNLDVVKEMAVYAQEFDNFNAYFVSDVKQSTDAIIENVSGSDIKITFQPGETIYNFVKEPGKNIGDVYRQSTKIATHVQTFQCTKRIIYINNTQKKLLLLNMQIGGNSNNSTIFTKTIQYTLKYWY